MGSVLSKRTVPIIERQVCRTSYLRPGTSTELDICISSVLIPFHSSIHVARKKLTSVFLFRAPQ